MRPQHARSSQIEATSVFRVKIGSRCLKKPEFCVELTTQRQIKIAMRVARLGLHAPIRSPAVNVVARAGL